MIAAVWHGLDIWKPLVYAGAVFISLFGVGLFALLLGIAIAGSMRYYDTGEFPGQGFFRGLPWMKHGRPEKYERPVSFDVHDKPRGKTRI